MNTQPPTEDANEAIGEPPEVEAEIVDAKEPAPPPPLDASPASVRAALRLTPAGPALLAVFALAIASAAFFYFRGHAGKKPPIAHEVGETAAEAASQKQTLDLGAAKASAPHADESPSPDKIFNSATPSLKDAFKPGPHHNQKPGTIDELPPAPSGFGDNSALQDAAKAAAKNALPQSGPPDAYDGAAIDLSSPDAQASLEDLANESPSTSAPVQSAPITPDQTAEIQRLRQDIARLEATTANDAQSSREAAFALSYARLATKARSGDSYEAEYRRLAGAAGGSPALLALAAHAAAGAPTLSALKSQFPKMRDAALAAARREKAKTPAARFGANIANFIRLRRAAPHEGDDAASIFSRSEAKLELDDVTGAVADLSALQGGAAVQASQWVADARARAEIDAALADLDAAIAARLASEPPAP